MKNVNQKLGTLALSLSLIGTTAHAAPGAAIEIKNNSDHSAWMTVYNIFDDIRDSGCVEPGKTITFTGYYGPIDFKVRAEVTQNSGCAHPVITDTSKSTKVSINAGADLSIEKGEGGGYYIQKQATQLKSETEENLNGSSATITTNNHTKTSVWVTVYNYFGSIRDSGCVNPGQTRDWTNYWGPLAFKVRAEVKSGLNCGGETIADFYKWVSVDPISGSELSLERNAQGGNYFWNQQ